MNGKYHEIETVNQVTLWMFDRERQGRVSTVSTL